MDLKQIEKLMQVMERSTIKRLAIKMEGFEIELEKGGGEALEMYSSQLPMRMVPERFEEKPQPSTTQVQEPVKPESASFYVTSPMVGTLYLSPAPDDPPFVKVGDVIKEESVVCIIEAMKVMNEVKAQIKGKILEVLLKSGDPVEFGTKIFRIEK